MTKEKKFYSSPDEKIKDIKKQEIKENLFIILVFFLFLLMVGFIGAIE